MASFNPFPWHGPKEDRGARHLEPLSGGGLGRRQATLVDRRSGPMTLALVAGIGFPVLVLVGILVLALAGAPPHVQFAGIVLVGAVVGIALRSSIRSRRAARRRSADRAARRADARESRC